MVCMSVASLDYHVWPLVSSLAVPFTTTPPLPGRHPPPFPPCPVLPGLTSSWAWRSGAPGEVEEGKEGGQSSGLVCLGCSNKAPQTWAYKQQASVLEAGGPRSRQQEIPRFLPCPHMGGRARGLSGASVIRAPIPSWDPTLTTSSPPKGPASSHHHPGLWFQHRRLGEHCIHPTARLHSLCASWWDLCRPAGVLHDHSLPFWLD